MTDQTSNTNTPLEPSPLPHLLLHITPTRNLPNLLKSLKHSDDSLSVLRSSQTQNHPKVTLRLQSPDTQSLGMRTALAWHREQLLEARLMQDQKNRQRMEDGMRPVRQLTTCSHALEGADPSSTVMDMTPPRLRRQLRRQHPYQSDLDPYHPQAWQRLISAVRTPSCWSISCPEPSKKTTKIPLKYRQPIQHQLPKGWVYAEDAEGVGAKRLDDPLTYQLDHPLTRAQHCQLQGRQAASRHQRQEGLSTTEEGLTSLSPSQTDTDETLQPVSSGST